MNEPEAALVRLVEALARVAAGEDYDRAQEAEQSRPEVVRLLIRNVLGHRL